MKLGIFYRLTGLDESCKQYLAVDLKYISSTSLYLFVITNDNSQIIRIRKFDFNLDWPLFTRKMTVIPLTNFADGVFKVKIKNIVDVLRYRAMIKGKYSDGPMRINPNLKNDSQKTEAII